MENASEALNMAFAVLIFVLALSIGISSFSLARQTSQTIIDRTDKTYDYTYVDFNASDTTRKVGAETIVPTLYRAYKENYIVKFVFKDSTYVYERKVNGNLEKTNEINLEKEAIANQERATLFIDYLLAGAKKSTDYMDYFSNITLQDEGFYSIIEGKTFIEELGIYYIEDTSDSTESSSDLSSSDINKTEKRVITYTE